MSDWKGCGKYKALSSTTRTGFKKLTHHIQLEEVFLLVEPEQVVVDLVRVIQEAQLQNLIKALEMFVEAV
ncbi:hypothetical protein Q8A72_18700 [Aeribacillus pallidus]|nr:hypothetical protein [Aeribacillus pallidus]